MQGNRISVLIVEDHSVVRWALRRLFEEQGMLIVGEASSVAEAIDLATIHEPDIVIMDLVLEDGSGIEAAKRLSMDGGRRVLAFSAYDSPDLVEAFFAAGGVGFVSKTSPVKDLLTAINAAMDNRKWVSPRIGDAAHASGKRGSERPALSGRERQVASLIARGMSSSQVAGKLFISLNTVETHRYRIFRKLGIHNRAQLVEYALRNGLVDSKRLAD